MAANYNNSAWFYDALSMMVYGRALMNAQEYLVEYIPAHARVLIAGGGTGRILESITRKWSQGLDIVYVEIAPQMMVLSKKRNIGRNTITYINAAIEDTILAADFDVVFTPFLFDNFTGQSFRKIFKHIAGCLKPGGLWLNCDFQLTGRWWQRVLLQSMFVFFRIICRIEGRRLSAIEQQFNHDGYRLIAGKNFFADFVMARVYTR